MKKDIKTFNAMVKEFRSDMPKYNKGRRVVVVDEYHENGKRVLAMASNYDGHYLNQVYANPSEEKIRIYNEAFEMCCNSGGTDFDIVSHNSYGFSVAWFNRNGNYDIGMVIVLTPKTEYICLCND